MSTVRDARIETPSAYRNVADLEFLIGVWTAEEHGVKTESVCRWVANKSFVERSYTVTHARRHDGFGRADDRLESGGGPRSVVEFQPRRRACCRDLVADGPAAGRPRSAE